MVSAKTVLLLGSVCLVNLAAGTMYLYGAYSPQVGLHLGYSASDLSKIAICGQSAMMAMGPVVGRVIDTMGNTYMACVSAAFVTLGYLLFYLQFVYEYSNVWLSCVLFLFIGVGSSTVLLVSMKSGLLVLPHHKGIATGLPNTFFGASGLFFSLIASVFTTGDTGKLLLTIFLITSTLFLVTLPVIFIIDRDYNSNGISLPLPSEAAEEGPQLDEDHDIHDLHNVEIEKVVLKHSNFWYLTIVLSILAGVTQMYIYSIGLIVVALHGGSHFIKINPDYNAALQSDQQVQVFLLSLFSCIGRLFNSFLGDIVVHKFDQTRLIILIIPLILTIIGTVVGSMNNTYNYMWIMSSTFGFGYGSLYSAMVQITSDLWGVPNFSFNWGLINLSPVVSNLILSSYMANVYDSHSKLIDIDDGKTVLICDLESKCYGSAFEICFFLSILASILALITYYRVVFKVKHVSK